MKIATRKPYDLAVWGDGPLACLSALVLQRAGYRVARVQPPSDLLQPDPRVPAAQPANEPHRSTVSIQRAIALSSGSLDFLRHWGAFTAEAPLCTPLRRLALRYTPDPQPFPHDPAPTHPPHCPASREWLHIQAPYGNAMGAFSPYDTLHAHWKNACEIAHRAGELHAIASENAPTHARILIRARGAKAGAAGAHALRCTPEPAPALAYALQVRLQIPHQGRAWQCFVGQQIIGLLPLPEPHTVNAIWSGPVDAVTAWAHAPIALQCQKLRWCFASSQPTWELDDKSAQKGPLFPLQRGVLSNWHHPFGVALGDEAHTIHPLAGQGMNTGITDLRLLLRALPPPGSAHTDPRWDWALDAYERSAKAQACEWFYLTEALYAASQCTTVPAPWKHAGWQYFTRYATIHRPVAYCAMHYAMGNGMATGH